MGMSSLNVDGVMPTNYQVACSVIASNIDSMYKYLAIDLMADFKIVSYMLLDPVYNISLHIS